MCKFEKDCIGNIPDSNNHCGVNEFACRIFTEKREKARAQKVLKGQSKLFMR